MGAPEPLGNAGRQFTGRWRGSLRTGSELEHEAFVRWLESADGADLLGRCNLVYYALYEALPKLRIVFRSNRPSIITGFLRNKRMWPDYWEFEGSADAGDFVNDTPRFQWTAP